MKLSRDLTLKIHFLLDQCLPPYLRDRKWCMWPFFRLLFGDKASIFFEFKEVAAQLSEEQLTRVYEQTFSVHISRETDLNAASTEEIEANLVGETLLDVGTGRGFLVGRLASRCKITATDIVIRDELPEKYPFAEFVRASADCLPFEDHSFDTVVCAHTLEHVPDVVGAVRELRRVTRRRLIVVVPRQRPYRYTFDLHLHFFPYAHSLRMFFRPEDEIERQAVKEIGGDLYLQEDRRPVA
jgi:ubiquinone/menaquinone biosynthesis C-methylase UbiE